MNIIVIDNLVVRIKKETVLNIDQLNISAGLCTGFIGRNGSGKSMLFKAICGFVKYYGTINVNGKQIGKDCDFIHNAGVIIEQPNFIGYLTPFENLQVLAEINKKVSRNQIYDVMAMVGLDPKCKKKTSKLSLGTKQRLRIAQALMEDPEILILDEPFNGLDKNGVFEIREVLLNMRQKKTILLTSHIKDDIDMLCDIVYEMENGQIINEITTNQNSENKTM